MSNGVDVTERRIRLQSRIDAAKARAEREVVGDLSNRELVEFLESLRGFAFEDEEQRLRDALEREAGRRKLPPRLRRRAEARP